MIQFDTLLTVERHGCDVLGDDGVSAAHTGESGCLRIAAELNSALACSLYLVYRVRYVVVLDIRLVSGIIEYDSVVVESVLHPFLQFVLRQYGARRIVGIAQVYHVDTMVGYLRHEIVFGCTRHIVDVAPASVLKHSGTTAHYVRIDIYRIDRVGHSDGVVPAHYLADVARIALGTVVDEHLIGVDMYASRCIIVLDYCLAQEVVSALRSVSVERCLNSHFVYGLVHSLYYCRTKRLCHVSYAETYHLNLRMRHLEGIHLLGYICKQVAVGQLQEMFVYQCHTC